VRLWDATSGAWKHTFKIGICSSNLLFSEDGQYLKTDRGLLSLNSGSFDVYLSQALDEPIYAISIDNGWVTQDGQKLLWLPPDFRPSCSAVSINVLAFGHLSGFVTFLEFVSS
jgi:hypothetical protein